MLRYLKYDFLGTRKVLFGYMIAGILGSLFIWASGMPQATAPISAAGMPYRTYAAASGIIVILVLMVSYITYAIRSYWQQLYSDQAYLMMSTPVHKVWMVASKLVTFSIWNLVYIAVGLLANGIFAYVFQGKTMSFAEYVQPLLDVDWGPVFRDFTVFGTGCTEMLAAVYFSITLSRTAIQHRRWSWIWIPILFLLTLGIDLLAEAIFQTPLAWGSTLSNSSMLGFAIFGSSVWSGPWIWANIGYRWLWIVILTVGSGWLLERKTNM